ncbi:ribbon-helix-helix domain-containing protein [Maricaulaceae bacterium MS644]
MLEKRSLTLAGHATSLALEPEFWAVIDRAAREDRLPLARLIARIDAERVAREPDQPLSSACRVFALERLQKLTP